MSQDSHQPFTLAVYRTISHMNISPFHGSWLLWNERKWNVLFNFPRQGKTLNWFAAAARSLAGSCRDFKRIASLTSRPKPIKQTKKEPFQNNVIQRWSIHNMTAGNFVKIIILFHWLPCWVQFVGHDSGRCRQVRSLAGLLGRISLAEGRRQELCSSSRDWLTRLGLTLRLSFWHHGKSN